MTLEQFFFDTSKALDNVCYRALPFKLKKSGVNRQPF